MSEVLTTYDLEQLGDVEGVATVTQENADGLAARGETNSLPTAEDANKPELPKSSESNNDNEASGIPGYTKAEVKILAEELGKALDPILAVHANTLIICDRLGGAKMTLGNAMLAIWPPTSKGAMILEGLPSVLAEVEKMLANRVEETEEEDPKEAEEEADPENKKEDEKPKEKPAGKPPAGQKEVAKTKNEPARPIQESIPPGAETVTGLTKPPAQAAARPELPIAINEEVLGMAAPEAAPHSKTETAESIVAPEALTFEDQVLVIAIDENGEIAEVKAAANYAEEVPSRAAGRPEVSAIKDELGATQRVPEVEYATVPQPKKVAPEPSLEFFGADLLTDPTFGGNMMATFIEEEGAKDDPEDFSELIRSSNKTEETDTFEDKSGQEQPAVITEIAVEPEILEEIETSLVYLVEQIQQSQPEQIKIVDEILDKIIEVPLRLEANEGEVISEFEAQEELEELFTKLFAELNVGYTPELVETLAKFVIQYNLIEEIKNLKSEEDIEQKRSDGTREMLIKFLKSASLLKAQLLAGFIGKTALDLRMAI